MASSMSEKAPVIHFVVRLPQAGIVSNLFRRLDPERAARIRTVTYEDLFACSTVPTGVYIFTGLGLLSTAQKQGAAEIRDCMHASGCVVLNHPLESLGRFDLLSVLHHEGINDFQVFRARLAQSSEPRYPVFIRSEGQHTGPLSPLLRTDREVETAVRRALSWGHRLEDLLVVEYCHVQDGDGYFRKYSAFRIGDEIIPSFLDVGREWCVKRGRVRRQGLALGPDGRADEELQFVQDNPHRDELRRVFDLARIRFGRADYAVRERRIVVWEINTAPDFGGHSRRADPVRMEERRVRGPARALFAQKTGDALLALASQLVPGEVTISFDRKLADQIGTDIRNERRLVRITRWRHLARTAGLGRLGRLKQPASWILARLINRSM